ALILASCSGFRPAEVSFNSVHAHGYFPRDRVALTAEYEPRRPGCFACTPFHVARKITTASRRQAVGQRATLISRRRTLMCAFTNVRPAVIEGPSSKRLAPRSIH